MKKFKLQIAAGVILIISGALVLLTDYINDKREVVFSRMNLVLSSFDDESIIDAEDSTEVIDSDEDVTYEEEEVEEVSTSSSVDDSYEGYLGIIEIPKIGLYKGFYDKNSSLNNVKFNLYVLPESNYPDVVNGNLLIAGHSGNYNNSYFANLYKLEIGDDIYIYYNNKSYVYRIDNIYNEEKTGTVRIFRNKYSTVLTLITCTKDDNEHQTIYIAYLVDQI